MSAATFLLAAAAGCNSNDPVYVSADTLLQTDGTDTEVTQTIGLKFRAPVDSEQKQLDQSTSKLGYKVPWLREDRVHVEVRYTVTNLGDHEGKFSLFVDGATEFTRFDYAAVAAAFDAANMDAPVVGLIQVSNPPFLAPGQVFQGTVREDDFHEASKDLDAMGRWMAPFIAVLINRSEKNPVGLEMVPAQWVLPAIWEITPRFSSDQPMTCQILVRIRDDDGRLWEDGETEFAYADLTTFTPVVMP